MARSAVRRPRAGTRRRGCGEQDGEHRAGGLPGWHVRRRPAGAKPAPRRDGRHRRPTAAEANRDPVREYAAGCQLRRAEPDRTAAAAASPAAAVQPPDLLHRRLQRPDRVARSGTHEARPDGPPRVVPDPAQARPQGHLRPVSGQGRPRSRARPGSQAGRTGARDERLLAGDDRAGLLDGADDRPLRGARLVRVERQSRRR